ncbi:hypothetical protein Tco_1533752 [Tanacetum coccineum]
MAPPNLNNTYTKPPLEIQILEFINTLGYDEDTETKMIVGIVHSTNLDFASLFWDEFEWQTVERSSRPSKISKLFYTCFTKLIIDYILSHNKSISRRSNSKLHSSQDDQPVNQLLSTTNSDYKFGMEVPDAMISDAIKKKAGYTYYMAKKVESEKAKIVGELEEQHVSLVKSGRGKGFICYGDQVVNVPNKLKKDVMPRKTRSLTIAEEAVVGELAKSISIHEPLTQQRRRSQLTIDSQLDDTVADTYAEWGQKLKGLAVEDLAVQLLLDLQKGSKASRLESLKQKKQAVAGEGSSAAHNKYCDSSDTDSDATLHSSSSDKTEEGANETNDTNKSDMDLSDDNPQGDDDAVRYGVFLHNKSTATPNYTYLSLTVTSSSLDFIQTLLDEIPTNKLMDFMSHLVYTDAQTTLEMFSDEYAHHIPSLPAKKIPYPTTTPQPSSLQSKAQKLMQKAKKNIKKINFKKAVAQKFREYDQKLGALTNFNVSKAFEKAIQEKVLTEIKKLLPTHIPKAVANYVRPRLNTFVLELYDTLYESICLDHDALNAQDAEPSFYKRSHDNQDSPNNHEGGEQEETLKGYQNENHILGPSTVAIAKKLKAIIQKDELTIADLEDAGLERLKQQYQNDVELEYHKYTTSITKQYAARYYKQGIEDMITDRWCKETHRYIFEALNGIHHWDGERIDFFKADMIRRSDDKEYKFSYADLPRLSLNDVEDLYLFQVQDKLHHLPLEFMKDFSNALLLFIRRVVIQNRVEDIQLGVESYQQILNLTKPMMFFEGID